MTVRSVIVGWLELCIDVEKCFVIDQFSISCLVSAEISNGTAFDAF